MTGVEQFSDGNETGAHLATVGRKVTCAGKPCFHDARSVLHLRRSLKLRQLRIIRARVFRRDSRRGGVGFAARRCSAKTRLYARSTARNSRAFDEGMEFGGRGGFVLLRPRRCRRLSPTFSVRARVSRPALSRASLTGVQKMNIIPSPMMPVLPLRRLRFT